MNRCRTSNRSHPSREARDLQLRHVLVDHRSNVGGGVDLAAIEGQRDAILECPDACRALLAIDQRHLAEGFAWAEFNQFGPIVSIPLFNDGLPLEQNEKL